MFVQLLRTLLGSYHRPPDTTADRLSAEEGALPDCWACASKADLIQVQVQVHCWACASKASVIFYKALLYLLANFGTVPRVHKTLNQTLSNRRFEATNAS